jgi:lysophospholipase L1-like esterase
MIGSKVINMGVGGLTAAEMEMDLMADLEEYGPIVFILSGGGNDIDYGRSADEVIGDLSSMAKTIKASGLVLVLCTLTPSALGPTDEGSRSEVNAWIRKNERGDWLLADIDEVLHDHLHPSRLARELDSGDGVHPNAKGMRMIAEVIARSMAR